MATASALPGGVDAATLEDIACRVARAAGRLVVDDRPEDLGVASKSTATDPVTEMDQRSQELIVALLGEERPDDGVLGEEEGGSTGTSGLTWVVDPIDGTVNYLYGIPMYAVSIAARVGDEVVAGVVLNPVSGELFTAQVGVGGWLDGRLLEPIEPPPLSHALVATGFGYHPVRRRAQAEVLAGLLPRVRDVRRAGSAALDICSVACGRNDAYYEQGTKPWDVAAAGLVATETGVTVTGLRGKVAGEALFVAARAPLITTLVELLESLDADRDPLADLDAEVVATMVGGRWVHNPPPWD